MTTVQIRGVPEPVHRLLRERAAANGESLNALLLQVVAREVARPTTREVLARAAARAEQASASSVGVVAAGRAARSGG